jgi:hypothetical protein
VFFSFFLSKQPPVNTAFDSRISGNRQAQLPTTETKGARTQRTPFQAPRSARVEMRQAAPDGGALGLISTLGKFAVLE